MHITSIRLLQINHINLHAPVHIKLVLLINYIAVSTSSTATLDTLKTVHTVLNSLLRTPFGHTFILFTQPRAYIWVQKLSLSKETLTKHITVNRIFFLNQDVGGSANLNSKGAYGHVKQVLVIAAYGRV